MRSNYITVLDREVHYTEFGENDPARPVVVMVHGFVRTCRDFDHLASFCATHLKARVICPDVIGRGLSQWSANPEAEYNPIFYGQVIAEMLRQLNVVKCIWFGTSMGGLIAMLGIAIGGPLSTMIEKLILNDVGPFVPPAALGRIMTYVVNPPVAQTVSELMSAMEETYRSFGYDLTGEQKHKLIEPCIRRLADGRVTVHWDPAILKGLKPPPPGTPDMWFFYDLIKCPTLVVRGEDSDVLLEETSQEMLTRGPKPTRIVIPRCGHAPVFMNDSDCEKLLDFLKQ